MCKLYNLIKVKTIKIVVLFLCFMGITQQGSAFDFFSSDPEVTEFKALAIDGQLEKENLVFTFNYKVQSGTDNKVLTLLKGDFALIDDDLGEKGELKIVGDTLKVSLTKKGDVDFSVTCAVKKKKSKEGYLAQFKLPDFQVRPVRFNAGHTDLELKLHSLLKVEKKRSVDNAHLYHGFMKLGEDFSISWKPRVEKLEKELSLICQTHSVASLGVGSLKVASLFDYKIVQGMSEQFLLKVPEGFSVTGVSSKTPLKNWQLIKVDGQNHLQVNLRQKTSGQVQLKVDGEQEMNAFPAKVKVNILEPMNVLRVSGFLALGTDSSIKIVMDKTVGLTQVEPTSFSTTLRRSFSHFPRRSLFVYNFASLPINLELTADKIEPVIFADSQFQYKVTEASVQLQSQIEMEVRDSAVREAALHVDKRFNVSSVRCVDLKDYEVFDKEDHKVLRLYFKQGVLGKRLLNVNFEWSHKGWDTKTSLPKVLLLGARTTRGFLSISGSEGLLTNMDQLKELRQVPVASLLMRTGDIQSAWRFKSHDWQASLSVKKKKTALYSELFHLYSLGENVIYGSVSITSHISGAPIDELKINIPEYCRNVEIIGRHRPRLYKGENNQWQVKLQRKINGDYTLLLSFEMNKSTTGGDFQVGDIELPESDSETGFITVSGPTGLKASVESLVDGLVQIDQDQVPAAYGLLHSHPVHLAFKYVRLPHVAKISLKTYEKVPLIDQVVEHLKMKSKINANGERVTEVECWIKNSSRQHLSLTLPKKSNFWSCKVDGKKVRCTSQGDLLQIPVPRNADPNKTIRVEYSYAELGDKLQEGMPFSMDSPKYNIPAIFNEWRVQFPGGFSIYKNVGSMDAMKEISLNQRLDIIALMESFVKWAVVVAKQPLCIFIFGLLLFVVCWQLPQVRVFGVVLTIILVSWSSAQILSKTNAPVYRASQPSYQVIDYKKTVSAANEVQKISGIIKDNSLQVSGESKPNAIAFVLGIALLVSCFWWPHFIPLFGAIVCFWFGCKGNTWAEYYFAVSLTLLIPIASAIGLSRYLGVIMSRLKARRATLAVVALIFFSMSSALSAKTKTPAPVYNKLNHVEYQIDTGKETARIQSVFSMTGQSNERFLLLKSPCALVDAKYDKKSLKLIIDKGQCIFQVLKKGEHRVELIFEVPLVKKQGLEEVIFFMPETMKNKASINLKLTEPQEIFSSNAIYFLAAKNKAKALFSNHCEVRFSWRPVEQKVSEIAAVFYVETQTLALAAEGRIDLQHEMKLKVAQGEVKHLLMSIPANQAVTSVSARELSNWAYDPAEKQLELLFNKGCKGDVNILVGSQIQSPKMPYKIKFSLPQVLGASRQNGVIAVGSREGVKIQTEDHSSLQEIDTVDFQLKQFSLNKMRTAESLLFTYRYFKFPVSASISASRVLPEIEVTDHANFSIGDERLLLNSRFKVNIKKAGVFELRLLLPDDYEVESLKAAGMSHWDEVLVNKQRQVIIYFQKRVRGVIDCHAVLVKNSVRKAAQIEVPKVSLLGERRHRGELVISAEQGNRLEIEGKHGVGASAVVNDGTMSMSILRKNWSVSLKREVLRSRIEVESLEAFRFADTRYQVSGRAQLKVENAGTKTLTLLAPKMIQNLEIRGKDIARTEKLSAGVWQLEFKRKIFGEYRLQYQYQHYYDSTKELSLEGIRIQGADRQRGYLCLDIPSYMSGTPIFDEGQLQTFESRLLPTSLSKSEDRKSTNCFRVIKSDWNCKLQFIRHAKAEILQANVQSVSIKTMVSLDGRQLHLVDISISSGSKNFLKMKLPLNSELCSVFSNGEPLQVSTQKGDLMIPLNQSMPGESRRKLQVIYIQNKQDFDWQQAKFDGPQFDLPLKEINWYLYVPKNSQYDEFAGSMKHIPDSLYFSNDMQQYLSKNKKQSQLSRENANVLLEQAYKLSSSGRRDLARKTFESVVNLSESMNDINEDARVQLQATLRQQTLVGLVNRRQNLKASASGGNYEFDDRRYNNGFFSDSFAKAVEKTLEEDESRFLSQVSDKIMAQQTAATQRLMPLRLALPQEGRQLHFYRQVQIEPMSAINVSFNVKEDLHKPIKSKAVLKSNSLLFLLIFLGSFLMIGGGFKRTVA